MNTTKRRVDFPLPSLYAMTSVPDIEKLSDRLDDLKPSSSSLKGDNVAEGENGGHFANKGIDIRNISIRGRKLRIPDTSAHLGLQLGVIEESKETRGEGTLISQPPSSSTDLTYENSPPKRNKKFIYKSCKLERGKIDQECNLPKISEDQAMPSLPIEILNNNEKLRKSSSYVFRNVSRRDSVVAKEISESERNDARRTSFNAPHKRRNSRYNLLRISGDESVAGSFEHVHGIFNESVSISALLLIQKLEVDGRNYICLNVDSIRKLLVESGLKAGSVSFRSVLGQSYLVYDSTENQSTCTEDQGETTDIMPPLVTETQKCKPTIGETIHMMQKYPDDVKIQLKSCQWMGSFAYDDSLSVLLAKNQGISCLLSALTRFANHDEILATAILSLARMCAASDACCVHIQKNDGIPELFKVLTSTSNLEVIEGAVDILGSMSAVEELREKLVEEGVASSVVTLLSRYEDNSKIVGNCCFILSNLVNDYQTAKNVMYVGGVHVIVNVMKRFQHDDLVHENACRALGSFAVHEDLSSDVSSAGATHVVIQTLKNFQASTAVLECALWALACLTKCMDAVKDICKNNEVTTVLNTLRKYPYDETLQEYGCWTLCNLSSYVDGAQELASADIVETVCQCLEHFPENLQLQQEIFAFLVPVLAIADDIQMKFIRDKRVKIILDRMTTYLDCPLLQEHGTLIIGTLAVNKANRTVLERLNASRTIITALLHHEDADKIHENGLIALTNLSAEIYGNKSMVERNGGVQAAITSLRTMSHNPDVVELALKMLGNLIELDAACYNFIEQKGLDVLETLLRVSNESQDTTSLIRNILIHLASLTGISNNDLENIERVLVTVSEDLGSDASVDVCRAQYYDKVVSTVNGCRMFIDGGSFKKLVDLLTSNATNHDIQFYGCKVMAALAMNGFHAERSKEIMSLVHTAMKNFPGELDLHIVSCGALCYLTEESDTAVATFLQEDGMRTLMLTINRFQEEPRLIVVAFMTLENLLKSEHDYQSEFLACYDVSMVIEIMRRFPDIVDIQIFGCKLVTLATEEDMKKNLDTSPILDILGRRKSMQDALIWAERALNHIKPGFLQADER
ncbi:uncharacterized protein LOC125679541 isoform X2 [Ostrea edulis]|uniref:uncharacterized protein LOC125679541 isoform X2 n=1 Tax=Ostrea edulis TaxID=37623 RepID=UPI0024AEE495|nr:uncharacterized protein LOC125679541 isoform X2 [Ostrea edulis]